MQGARLGWALVSVLAIATVADAGPKTKPGKGFWRVLVQPGAKWVLHDTIADEEHETPRVLTVETYDVRKIGKAAVARVRWTLQNGSDKPITDALASTEAGAITQFAVTDDGLYTLWAGMDDAKVAKALEGKPSRSDPPKAYEGTKLNEGRYVTIDDDGTVCMGQGPKPGAGMCEDTCDGQVCISATDGIVEISGTWSPGVTIFKQR
jgi:hypothetical protein